jgi:hypothetical protein
LKKNGIAIQYSVFLVYMNTRDLDSLAEQLKARLNAKEDDLRLYSCQSARDIWLAGVKSDFWQTGEPRKASVDIYNKKGQDRRKNQPENNADGKGTTREKRAWFWRF